MYVCFAGHYLVGQFMLEDGRLAVLLQNQDPYQTQWPANHKL